ncbi:aldose 1-epimerase family protein [Sphingomonas morindae]|uniref:Aldose 1-epimerase family protein n=1 Tax=Sphingomonas morindae TaxID=1541170 RepID=A0ABY4X8E9_9SPHN|nr:aldose 1-epimerase family protein [Sphingomonas morindae]USI73212.1 aldose 1-epimerase family protein [Sphingomonas morindae]
MTDLVTLRSADLTVTIAPLGAELQSITDAAGQDWLWDGDARWWTGRAPLLFPTVGMLADGARFDGTRYPLGKHGFAREQLFACAEADSASARFTLRDSAESLAHYPFRFELAVTHHLAARTLTTSVEISNRDSRPMPFGFGFHPALRWPLPGTGAQSRFEHIIRFDADEPEPLRAITDQGLIAAAPRVSPVHDNEIHLHDSLFEQDALVWDRPASRGLYFGVAGQPGVRVDFADMPMLGIWTKPGAGYLCIEPWHSHADAEGFAGEFADKPGVITLAPDERRTLAMALTIGVPI